MHGCFLDLNCYVICYHNTKKTPKNKKNNKTEKLFCFDMTLGMQLEALVFSFFSSENSILLSVASTETAERDQKYPLDPMLIQQL